MAKRGSDPGSYQGGPGVDETNDEPVSKDDPGLSVVHEVLRCRQEAWDAKQSRLRKNSRNMEAYFGRQDWSLKQDGQSTEFIPKTGVAVEQMGNFIKRGLIKFGAYYSVNLDINLSKLITGEQVRSILDAFLEDLWVANNRSTSFPIVISDGIKNALLQSLVILKVHGAMMPSRKFRFTPGSQTLGQDGNVKEGEPTLEMEEEDKWKLRIDLVRPEDYYPDPTGNGLYEIHSVERDIHEIISMADQGIYDKKVVDQLIGVDYKMPEDEKRQERDRNQDIPTPPSFRKTVVLDEFWGTLLNQDGTIAERNIVTTVANSRFLIRPPEENPFWHQESPFVATPIVRVPWSEWHKALFDDAISLNLAQNELFNLIIDGGMAAVWGTKQIRIEDLEDPGQVAGGLRQGMTLAVKQTLPHNAKVVEECSTGNVPNDAMVVYEALDREFNAAVMTNELKLGSMPSKQVRATEVVELNQSQAVTLDGMTTDIERTLIAPALYKAWLCVLQNADDINPIIMQSVTDRSVANIIARASPEERFALFAGKTQFKVFGLSATMAKALDFQKFMSLLQAVNMNPMLFRAFMQKFSPDKALRTIMTKLNISPDDLQMSIEEQAQASQAMQQTLALGQAMNPQGGGGQQASAPGASAGGAPLGGGGTVPAQINQGMNPTTGLVPNA